MVISGMWGFSRGQRVQVAFGDDSIHSIHLDEHSAKLPTAEVTEMVNAVWKKDWSDHLRQLAAFGVGFPANADAAVLPDFPLAQIAVVEALSGHGAVSPMWAASRG
jgi:hypothetical protein